MAIPEEVLWRQRLENWDKHFECVLLLSKLLLEQKELVMQHTLRVHVFNEDPESLAVSVNLLLPLKIRCDGQLNAQRGPGHGLNVADQVQLGELVNVPVVQL